MAHANETLLREATDALNRGDMETFLDFHADDVKLHTTGRNRFANDIEGKEELGRLFGEQIAALDEPPTFELHDVLATDDHGVIVGVNHFKMGGRTLDSRTIVVLHLQDGKATEIWVMPTDPYAEDEFFA